jgi:uridine phosphorylase
MGDCFRTEFVAKMCDKFEEIAWNREFRVFNVEFEGV